MQTKIIHSLHLLRPDRLKLSRRVNELRRICLRKESPLVRLLHKVLISLLLRESDCILLALKCHFGALHEVARGLPAHEGVLPSMTLLQNIPIHAPLVTMPVAGLCCRFGGFEDANDG